MIKVGRETLLLYPAFRCALYVMHPELHYTQRWGETTPPPPQSAVQIERAKDQFISVLSLFNHLSTLKLCLIKS